MICLSRHQYWPGPLRQSIVRIHFRHPWRAFPPASFPSLEACSRRHYVALRRFRVLFRPGPLQVGPGRRLLGLAKFATKSRTAKTAVLLTFPSFFRRFRRRERPPRAEGAQRKSYNERTPPCRGGQGLDPRQALPKRGQGIDPDSPETTSPKIGAEVKPLGVPPCKDWIGAVFLCQSRV